MEVSDNFQSMISAIVDAVREAEIRTARECAERAQYIRDIFDDEDRIVEELWDYHNVLVRIQEKATGESYAMPI